MNRSEGGRWNSGVCYWGAEVRGGLRERGWVMGWIGWIGRLFRPLASRKVRVALATVLAAYAAEYGLGASEEVILTLVSVGVALILGIAHEDAGQKRQGES